MISIIINNLDQLLKVVRLDILKASIGLLHKQQNIRIGSPTLQIDFIATKVNEPVGKSSSDLGKQARHKLICDVVNRVEWTITTELASVVTGSEQLRSCNAPRGGVTWRGLRIQTGRNL